MKKIGVTDFKARCLGLLDRLGPDGLVITKHGKPIARVVPYEQEHADLIGSLKHRIRIRGDIMTTGIRWDADAQS